jgi:predicted PurR-regulated permease PerM
MRERPEFMGPGAKALFLMASVTVVVAGLRAAAPILLPFALALFIAILSLPIMLFLQRRGAPRWLAILLAVLADLAVIALLIFLLLQSVADFQERGAMYAARLQNLFRVWTDMLQDRGIPIGEYIATELISMSAMMDLAGGTISRIASFLSGTFLVILILSFILAEASVFPAKFQAALEAGQGGGNVRRFSKIVDEILGYLAIKTLVSLATGLAIGLFAWFMGLDFPVLLGLIGFALNYVPTIGSILAAVPALILALIQFGGLGPMAVVALAYLAINVVFGNFIEPTLLGRRLGLSTLVVVLSLLFWAWVWGPVGALLAVPLTMMVKIMLENTKDLRWIALLLDKEAPSVPPSDSSALPEVPPSPSS